MPRVIAERSVICSSCGDGVNAGKPISLEKERGQTIIKCMRCDPPAMETAKINMRVRPESRYKHQRKK